MAVQTVTISKLIKILEDYKKELGDMPVIHSSDPEGNSYGTVSMASISYMETTQGNMLVIAPHDENIEDDIF